MFHRREVLIGSAATIAASSAQAPALATAAPQAGRASRRSEVAALRTFAETTHPRGREAAASETWRDRWASIEDNADRLADGAYFVSLRQGLGWFEDGHTTLLPFEFVGGVPDALKAGPFGRELPVRILAFHDGAFVTATDSSVSALRGRRIDQIGAMSTIDFMRAHADRWPGNKAWSHRWAGQELSSPALLHGFGAVRDPAAPIAFVTDAGTVEVISRPQGGPELAEIDRVTSPRELWAKEAGGGNYVRPIGDRRAIYISIDDMADVEGKTFQQLTEEALAAIASPSADRVVIDLRRNGGGNNYWGEPLRKALAASRFNRPGGLYVLISPVTFSAAQNLANRLERETFTIFVGEPTGGAPNHYGDAKPFQGTASGITAIVSTLPWLDSYPQDVRPWIAPDLPVPETFADWRAGRDRALATALDHRSDATANFLSRDSVFFFNRQSQKAAWKPFWL